MLAALLATGAAAALTWFPLQRPITAVPILLAAGRAWRVAGEPETAGGHAVRLLRAAGRCIAVLAALLAPEIPRYAAERRVGRATAAFRSLLDRAGDPEAADDLVARRPVARSPSRRTCRAIRGRGFSGARRTS